MMDGILRFFGLCTLAHAGRRYLDGVLTEQERQCEQHDRIRLNHVQSMVDKPVIGISNEWEDPLIGTVIGIDFITRAKNPVPIVRCALTGKEFISLCSLMPFTIQRFDAIMKLTPYERWCMIDRNLDVNFRDTNTKDKPELFSRDELIRLLQLKKFSGLPTKDTV